MNDTQDTLDRAQDDLESDIAELKHVVEGKLETPKHVVETIRKPIAFARRHALVLGVVGIVVLGLILRARRSRER